MRLTEEQKAQRREAKKAKQKLYDQRRKEFTAAMEAATGAADVVDAERARDDAVKACEEAWDAKSRAIEDIDRQIRELQILRERENERLMAVLRPLREEKTVAVDAAIAARRSAENAVYARFPDMRGVWGQGSWTPPEGYALAPSDRSPKGEDTPQAGLSAEHESRVPGGQAPQ